MPNNNNLSREDKALLAAHEKQVARRRSGLDVDTDQPEQPEKSQQPKRGRITPVQWDDDGWGDTPVQMRGE